MVALLQVVVNDSMARGREVFEKSPVYGAFPGGGAAKKRVSSRDSRIAVNKKTVVLN